MSDDNSWTRAVFEQADKDSNGALTMEEFSFALADFGMEDDEITELFLRLDTNTDGRISAAEFDKLEGAMAGDADEEDVANMSSLVQEHLSPRTARNPTIPSDEGLGLEPAVLKRTQNSAPFCVCVVGPGLFMDRPIFNRRFAVCRRMMATCHLRLI
jgi:hypothetical protein